METEKEKLDRGANSILDKIRNDSSILKANKDIAESWLNFLRAKGLHQKTIIKNSYCIYGFLKAIPPKVRLEKATKDEIGSAIAKIEGSDYSPETKHQIKVAVKSLFKHYLGEDVSYPREVAWIKTTMSRNKKKLPEDLLTEEEIKKLIEAAGNARDKAIIALLYDSGIRAGELLSLRKKDIDLTSEPQHITVEGKTGMRRIPIMFSAPYLARYLDMTKDKKASDYLWTSIGTWTNINVRVNDAAIRKVLQNAAKKAKIEKRMYPHLFRHSRATYYANRITEQQLKHFFGWTGNSNMAATYVHMSGRDIDDAILQVSGKKPKEIMAPKLTEKICPRCREPNGIDFVHCSRCGAALDLNTLLKEQELTGDIQEMGIKKIKGEDLKSDVVKNIKDKKKDIK